MVWLRVCTAFSLRCSVILLVIFFSVLIIWFAINLASVKVIGRGYASALLFVPALLGSILVSTLESHNKVGLLFSFWISSEFF